MFFQDKANSSPVPLPEEKELSILRDKEKKPIYHTSLPYNKISGHIYHSMFLC